MSSNYNNMFNSMLNRVYTLYVVCFVTFLFFIYEELKVKSSNQIRKGVLYMFDMQSVELLLNGLMWGSGLSIAVAGIYVSMTIREKKAKQQ